MRIAQVDSAAAVRENFLFIEFDDHRDPNVGLQGAVLPVHVLFEAQPNLLVLSYFHAFEFDRRTNAQAVDIAAEVNDKFVRLAEQAPGPEDHDCGYDQPDRSKHERAYQRWIDSLTHGLPLIFSRLIFLRLTFPCLTFLSPL